MFVNGVEIISTKLENINLDIHRTMQPKSERPPLCPKGQVPLLHLTPTHSSQKKERGHEGGAGACAGAGDSPWLLKPTHDIPATPPPQTEPQAFFPQRVG